MIKYNPNLKQYSRNLRNESTLSEVILWNKLKGKQIIGYQFLRQKPLDNFIADFYCSKLRLIIEIDGSSHDGKEEYDAYRQEKLEALGLNFLRFTNLQVLKDIRNVLRTIENYILEFEKKNLQFNQVNNN